MKKLQDEAIISEIFRSRSGQSRTVETVVPVIDGVITFKGKEYLVDNKDAYDYDDRYEVYSSNPGSYEIDINIMYVDTCNNFITEDEYIIDQTRTKKEEDQMVEIKEKEFLDGVLEMYRDCTDIPFIDCYYDNDKYKVVLVWDAGYWVYGDMEPDSKVWESIFQKIELTWSTASQRFAIWTRFFGYEEDEYYDALIEELKKDVIQLEGNIAFTPTEVLRKTCLVIEDKEEPNEWDEELYDMAYHELHERGKELR